MAEPVTLVALGGGLLGLSAHLARRYFETAKAVLDVILATALLIVSAPMILICAIMIKLSSRGSVFYSQVRVGRDGKLFRIYKLRTMFADAERNSGAVWAGEYDSRVVPMCRWMRRAHVDELPQLINVIRGEMSLVGPRPERPEILKKLQELYPHVNKRLAVRPGITGLAQIRNGYDTNVESFGRKLEDDLEYIANRRWSLEFAILMKTLTKLRDKSAH
ncbi:MAG: sugar transferase [Planctomycetota bacterium]|jgi:lipopolysaccharide/colanic/teichoic acid biosynthesis glycosyltransferase